MPFKPGQSGNPSGRGKGNESKTTKQKKTIIDTFSKLIEDEAFQAKFEKELNKLEGKDFFATLSTFIEYILPKLARKEIKIDDDTLMALGVIHYPQKKLEHKEPDNIIDADAEVLEDGKE
jgi:hypothetical protein